jgi:hypothetical protein
MFVCLISDSFVMLIEMCDVISWQRNRRCDFLIWNLLIEWARHSRCSAAGVRNRVQQRPDPDVTGLKLGQGTDCFLGQHLVSSTLFSTCTAQTLYIYIRDVLGSNLGQVTVTRAFTRGTPQSHWAISPLKFSGYYMHHFLNTLKLCILPTKCICVFHTIPTINSDCFPKQH